MGSGSFAISARTLISRSCNTLTTSISSTAMLSTSQSAASNFGKTKPPPKNGPWNMETKILPASRHPGARKINMPM